MNPTPQPFIPTFVGRGEIILECDALPLPLAREVETAYQRFESAWRDGQQPVIEDVLGNVPAPARPVLLPELLELELYFRMRAGEIVHSEEYVLRFPEHAELIEALLRESRGTCQDSETASRNPDDCLAHDSRGALPTYLGRYRVTALLGAGGCGVVYKAHDDDLEREVAIKVPHRHRIATAADIEAYLVEARMLATLDHTGIVPVHDFGRTADGLCYVVSKFVAGQDLRAKLQQSRPTCAKAVALIAQVAEALHHAHRRGLVHRDVKPANILLDEQGRPVVVDFGLALRDADFGTGPQLAGTPAYMSPEQARGEGHRVDARSDIYSLGVVLYELLTGQRPYRSDRLEDVLEEIKTQEPRPPRLLNDAVPAELDRICLRALAKRAADRYSTAQDLAADLRDWLDDEGRGQWGEGRASDVAEEREQRDEERESEVVPQVSHAPLASRPSPLKVVPKGLRAYDAADADFFLELLPGPRDRHGLPDSIRFWKQRIEETDASQTFNVGLLYGPSGCGKSSLVKAGLLPRLAKQIQVVYVEATPAETEARLLKGLRKRCPQLSEKLGLIETLSELRRHGLHQSRHSKLLLVIDQFEQWLHAKRSEQHTELVQALRQCDGEHVQCLALVRDDFGMAATRFMNDLEIRIVEGHNFATVDLFDLSHARNVLVEFGRAFGQLQSELSAEQQCFLDQAVASLAQDGKVISVRLALFAEMVKSKPWTSATLRHVGGAEGVGVTFLEETFSAYTAPPTHRLHQLAARAVLKALLPEPGADLKGHMRSHQELQEAAGYVGRSKDFADLVHILDTELRLMTPTEGGTSDEAQATSATGTGLSLATPSPLPPSAPLAPHPASFAPAYYQLTHDYLVPTLRQWLTRKQRETRQGRMELLLAERVALWAVKEDSRQLPGWWEWLNILVWTRTSNRTDSQHRMLRSATRKHLFQASLLVLFATMFGWILWEVYRGPVTADHLVRSLASADIDGVEKIIEELESCRKWADPKLRILAQETSTPKERLHASLALLPEPQHVAYLEKQLLEVGPDEALVIAKQLRRKTTYGLEVAARLEALIKTEKLPPDRHFRAACVLAYIHPGELWKPPDEKLTCPLSDQVVNELVKMDLPSAQKWSRLPMERVSKVLAVSLSNVFIDPNRPESERAHAAVLTRYSFLTYSISAADKLMDLVLQIEGEPYSVLNQWFVTIGQDSANLIDRELDKSHPAQGKTLDDLARRQAHAAVILLQLEEWDKQRGPLDRRKRITPERLWPLLEDSTDSRLHSLRSYLTRRFARVDIDAKVILDRYASERDTSTRRALLMSLREYKDHQLPHSLAPHAQRFQDEYREDPDAGIHSALDSLLRQWKHREDIDKIDCELATGKTEGSRRWYVTARHGHTLAVVPATDKFVMGSPQDEPHRLPTEKQHEGHVPRAFAIATKEVTVKQFKAFLKDKPDVHGWGLTERLRLEQEPDEAPLVGVSWYAAAQYCRWLSEQEGIAEDQMCYPKIDEIKNGMALPANFLSRGGYRLPTEAEWEYACRAGAATSRPYGSSDALLEEYAWYERNSHGRARPVAGLKPNDFGLFDMLGNASEWCHDEALPYPSRPLERQTSVFSENQRVLRGGGYFSAARELRSAHRGECNPQLSLGQAGLRVARTWR